MAANISGVPWFLEADFGQKGKWQWEPRIKKEKETVMSDRQSKINISIFHAFVCSILHFFHLPSSIFHCQEFLHRPFQDYLYTIILLVYQHLLHMIPQTTLKVVHVGIIVQYCSHSTVGFQLKNIIDQCRTRPPQLEARDTKSVTNG